MLRSIGWIGSAVLVIALWLSFPYASYAQSTKCSKCITKSALRIASTSQDATNNTLRLNTQQFIVAPFTQYFPGPAGQTIMTMDFPGILWDKPAQLISPANEEIESIRMGQFQCDPPVFRITVTTSNPSLLKKIAVENQSGSLILKLPPATPRAKVASKPLVGGFLKTAGTASGLSTANAMAGRRAQMNVGGLLLDLKKAPLPPPVVVNEPSLPLPGGSPYAPALNDPTSINLANNNQTSAPLPGSPALPDNQTQSGGTITGGQLMPPNAPPYPNQNQARWGALSRIAAPAVVAGGTAAMLSRRAGSTTAQVITSAPSTTVSGWSPPSFPSSGPIPSLAPLPGSTTSTTTTTSTTINRRVSRTTNTTTTINNAPAISVGGQLAGPSIYPPQAPVISTGGGVTLVTNNTPGTSAGSTVAAALGGAAVGGIAGGMIARGWPQGTPAPAAPTSGLAQLPGIGTPGSALGGGGSSLPLNQVTQALPQATPLSAGPALKLPQTQFPPNAPSIGMPPNSASSLTAGLPQTKSAGTLVAAGQLMPDEAGGGIGLIGGSGNSQRPFVSVNGNGPITVIIRFDPRYSTYKSFRLYDSPRYVVDVDNGPVIWDIGQSNFETNPWLNSVRIGRPESESAITRVVLDLGLANLSITESYDQAKGWLTLIISPPKPKSNSYFAPGKSVVLDAGHGGSDPGAQRGDVQEKELTLAVTKKLEKYLQAHGIKTQMTRTNDSSVSLEERVRITNEAMPDAFVSIHINSLETNSTIHGIETYYQTEQSRALADKIHQSLVTGLTAPDRSVRKARFYVVNHTPVPAVLAEVGFISNKEERDNLISSDYQAMIAESVGQGVMLYLSGQLLPAQPSLEGAPPPGPLKLEVPAMKPSNAATAQLAPPLKKADSLSDTNRKKLAFKTNKKTPVSQKNKLSTRSKSKKIASLAKSKKKRPSPKRQIADIAIGS